MPRPPAFQGLPGPGEAATQGAGTALRALTVLLHFGYVLLYSCSEGWGLSVAWTMSTAAKGRAELMEENGQQSDPARQHRLENME